LESFLRAVQKDENLKEVQRPVEVPLQSVRDSLHGFFQSHIPVVEKVGNYAVGVPGKLFRPTLLLLVSGQCEGLTDNAVYSASIVELIHTATLIHDDTIDRSQLRRGRPTLNAIYDDFGATVVGDFVYTKALVNLMDRNLHEVLDRVARTAYRMSMGEMLQLQHRGSLEIPEEGYFELIDYKTASLMSCSCEVGTLFSAKGKKNRERFREFGHHLGLAYQITDDLFDFVGDSQQLGKILKSDLQEGKVTLPMIHALSQSTPAEKKEIHRIVQGPSMDSGDWDKILDLLDRYSGLDYGRRRALELADRARALLENEDQTPYLEALALAVDYAVARTH
jgi:octaprenyl-diphosphate synthase